VGPGRTAGLCKQKKKKKKIGEKRVVNYYFLHFKAIRKKERSSSFLHFLFARLGNFVDSAKSQAKCIFHENCCDYIPVAHNILHIYIQETGICTLVHISLTESISSFLFPFFFSLSLLAHKDKRGAIQCG
jgi:hypothetical protein